MRVGQEGKSIPHRTLYSFLTASLTGHVNRFSKISVLGVFLSVDESEGHTRNYCTFLMKVVCTIEIRGDKTRELVLSKIPDVSSSMTVQVWEQMRTDSANYTVLQFSQKFHQ